jgi:hypothetical protein
MLNIMNVLGTTFTVILCLHLALPGWGSEESDAADVRFDLVFEGGTASELVARVHRLLSDQKVEKPLNINVMPAQAATPIPPLSLRQVSFKELAGFLRKVSSENARGHVQVGRAAQTFGFEESGGIWFFTVSTEEGVGRAAVEVVNDRVAIYRVKAAPDVDVMGVLQDTFRSAGRALPRHAKYQQASQALVLRGVDEDHKITLKAVQLLEQDSTVQTTEVLRLEEEKRRLMEHCARLEKDLTELKTQVQAMSKY